MQSFFTLVVALLPAITLTAAAPSRRTCTPTDTFLAAGPKVINQSSLPSSFWNAVADGTSFIAVQDVPESDVTPDSQKWNLRAINGGFAFQSVAFPSSCIQGDGGPVDGVLCPNIDSGSVPPLALWTITCSDCGDNFALGCTIQATNEGQCAEVQQISDNTIVLEDCDSTLDTQVFDISLS